MLRPQEVFFNAAGSGTEGTAVVAEVDVNEVELLVLGMEKVAAQHIFHRLEVAAVAEHGAAEEDQMRVDEVDNIGQCDAAFRGR